MFVIDKTAVIHPTAVIEEGAVVGAGVRIGPYCCVGGDVEIGEGTVLKSHVVVSGHTCIGRDNIVYPFATIGEDNQDLKYAGEPTLVEIGDRNRIRESVTIHRGTVQGGGITRVGNDNLLMVNAHVAHDCIVSNHCILANNATLGGHVILDVTPTTQFDQSVGYATDRQFVYANNPGIPSDEFDSTRLSTTTSLTHQERGLTLFGLPLSGESKVAYDFSRELAFMPVDVPQGLPARNDSSFSLHQSATLGALTVFLAGRHDVVQGVSVNTGNVAVAYAITPVYTARLSYGNAFRLPTFNDLYYPGYSNPNLLPERSDTVEAALDASTSIGTFTAAVYDTRVHDLISFNPALSMPVNIGRAHIQGIDLSYKGTIGKSTPVSVAVGIMNPQDVTDQTWLPRRPRQTISLSVDHMWDEFHLHALSTGVSLLYGGSTFDDQYNTTYLPSYTRVDLRAAYRINSHLTVSANLSNLFNRQYVTAYGYKSLGRTAFGKVAYTF